MHALSEKLRCKKRCGGDGRLRTDGYCEGGAGGAALLGGALYFGNGRFGDGIFFRLCTALCILSELEYCERKSGKAGYDRETGGNIFRNAGKRGE